MVAKLHGAPAIDNHCHTYATQALCQMNESWASLENLMIYEKNSR
jgi:hypothetical protein